MNNNIFHFSFFIFHFKKTLVFLILCLAFVSEAKVKLPILVSDGMVLQREQEIVIWGKADAGEGVTVVFNKKKYSATTDSEGKWNVILPAMKAGGPFTMIVNDVEIKDILIGDVWLCSGQSNMELPIRRVLDLYADEVKDYENLMIRYVKTPTSENYHRPLEDIPEVSWLPLTTDNALSYAALCYFFARDLYEKTKVPIGIINSSVGGSPIEAWISEEGLKKFPHYLSDRDLHRSDSYVANVRKLEFEKRKLWNDILNKEDKGLNENVKWNDPDYDDSDWNKMDLNNKAFSIDGLSFINGSSLFNFFSSDPDHHINLSFINGSFWFRKDIDLPASLSNKEAILRLGCIVDADSVFVNGVFVGTISYQYPPRIYKVPAGLLKQGKNNITIRVISNSGRAEFVDDKPYKLIIEGNEIDLRNDWKFKIGARMPAYSGPPSVSQKPTGFYNGMIAPLQNFKFKGAIWYQGETNAGRHHEYFDLLSSLINNWRTLFKSPDLPFFIAQLPNYMRVSEKPSDGTWAYMREAQQKVTQVIPNTGLAVAIDAGEWNDIHPLNKKDIGKRISLQAQRIAYGDKKIIADGPIFDKMEMSGNQIIISFKEGTNDLMPVDELKGFAIAGEDNIFKWAKAKIENNKVVVWNDEISKPVKIRYAWADNPGEVNLRNKSALPASPFRTDILY